MAPIKPMATAAQRRRPTTSPNKGTLSAVTIRGETKVMATASARDMYLMAVKKITVHSTSNRERKICSHGREVRSRPRPRRGQNIAAMMTN